MIKLLRVNYGVKCTRGLWIFQGGIICVTLENPWLDNKPNISCIPEGYYVTARTESNRFGRTFEVSGVTGRTRILIHWGNTAKDTEGCILLGTEFGVLDGEPAILKSRKAFGRFNALMDSMGVTKFGLSVEKLEGI